MSCGLGVEVQGLTPALIDDAAIRDQLAGLLDEHLLIKTEIEDLSEEDQSKLAGAFGVVTSRDAYKRGASTSGTQYVSNSREDGILGKGRLDFHHDHLFYENPLCALMLYAIEIPASGSETRFRSAVSFLDALPAELRNQVGSIECKHLYDYGKLSTRSYRDWDDPESSTPGSLYDYKPFVWRHARTAKEALLLSQSTIDFRGIDREQGIALYKQLAAFAEQNPEKILTYNHHWKPGDLIIWDNLMVAHARMPFDKTQPRTLRRTPIVAKGALELSSTQMIHQAVA